MSKDASAMMLLYVMRKEGSKEEGALGEAKDPKRIREPTIKKDPCFALGSYSI